MLYRQKIAINFVQLHFLAGLRYATEGKVCQNFVPTPYLVDLMAGD